MALEKLEIEVEGVFLPLKVLFNPEQIQISRDGWSQQNGQFVGKNNPATLTVNLFFDTTLPASTSLLTNLVSEAVPSFLLDGWSKYRPEDVRNYTQQIYNLTRKQGKNRPPFCKLTWGRGNVLLSRGFLKSVTKSLTHFLEDGTPVRALLNCTFEEILDPELEIRIQNPIDDPVRTVKRGETLSSMAAEEFNDPALWRLIAEANQMDNPRQLVPGQRLTVPPLRIDRTSGRGA
jgi:hypothetical protein